MEYVVHTLKGVNSIEFGMTVDEVRNIMSGQFETFRRGGAFEPAMNDHPSDFYTEEGVFCYYDTEGHLEAMEFTNRARVLLGGVNVFELPIGRAVELLTRLDPEAVVDWEGAVSHGLSLAVWSPEASEDENAPVESFLTGRPGYYDDVE